MHTEDRRRPRIPRFVALIAACALPLASVCDRPRAPPDEPPPSRTATPSITLDRFNRAALRLNLPLLWASDTNGSGAPDPDEVRTLLFYAPLQQDWVRDGAFTPEFSVARARIDAEDAAPPPDDARRSMVRAELDNLRLALVDTDLSELGPSDRDFVAHMLSVASLIDRLYARQTGMEAVAHRVDPADSMSASLFRRNWGPRCRSGGVLLTPACSAIDGNDDQPVDAYPAALQVWASAFCRELSEREDGAQLLAWNTVVREQSGVLTAVGFWEAYEDLTGPAAIELRAAATALPPTEAVLATYLREAARELETGTSDEARAAFAAMDAFNSRWYVDMFHRDTAWDPCGRKAGFQLTFGRISAEAGDWQMRLRPLYALMEPALAALVPGEYAARAEALNVPDIVDLIANAGAARRPFGSLDGFSLPRRTVVMANLYAHPETRLARRARVASVVAPAGIAPLDARAAPELVLTIFHETAHNIGPLGSWRTQESAHFGADAWMMSELQAHAGALYLVGFARNAGLLSEEEARVAYLDGVMEELAMVAAGPREHWMAASRLAGLVLGVLFENGGLSWDPDATAADGVHRGAILVDYDRMPAAATELMRQVMHILATRDRTAYDILLAQHGYGQTVPLTEITERYADFPYTSLAYSIRW